MSTTSFQIRVDLGTALGQLPAIVNQSVLPNLSQAVYAVADVTARRWKNSVKQAKLWDGEKQAYVASITWRETGPFSAVVESDYKHAEEIDNGRPARDLKRMLQTSTKTRRAKDGRRYLIIPFRHGDPKSNTNPMPSSDYPAAKALKPSRVVGMTTRVSASGHTVPQRVYNWGARLQSQNKRLDGMYRFDTSSGKQNRSTYLTFRVMSESSSGWIIPPKPGLFLVKKLVDEMGPKAEMAFSKAMEIDTTV